MIRELLLHSKEFISINSWPEFWLLQGIYRFKWVYNFINSSVTFGDAIAFRYSIYMYQLKYIFPPVKAVSCIYSLNAAAYIWTITYPVEPQNLITVFYVSNWKEYFQRKKHTSKQCYGGQQECLVAWYSCARALCCSTCIRGRDQGAEEKVRQDHEKNAVRRERKS